MKVYLITHGCKANQYDTEKFRLELESRGASVVDSAELADACVINTCTVTNAADAEARKAIRKVKRENPGVQVVVAGCSAALRASEYSAMDEVFGVVPGQDPNQVAALLAPESPLLDRDQEPIGAILTRNRTRSRGWLKVQDGCDRKCSFCATRLARGVSRSLAPEAIIAEALSMAPTHRELVLTGIHIGHYGVDLDEPMSLSRLVARLIEAVPGVRFRLGSIEATEIDDLLVDLLATSNGALVPHLHIPMQSGSDDVLKLMRRWHSREQYRSRILEIAERVPYFGLGADVIVGFPGESEESFANTRALVDELPFTYLHVFPYSERSGTVAADLPNKVPPPEKAARSKDLRELAVAKGLIYRTSRVGQAAEIVVEENQIGLTEDYLKVRLTGNPEDRVGDLVYASLLSDGKHLTAHI